DERAAGVARVDRRVGLDEEAKIADAELGAGQRRDDAAGDGLPDAERIADRQHEIADLELVAVAQLERRKALAGRLDLEEGEAGADFLTTGANESWIAPRSSGTVRVWAVAGSGSRRTMARAKRKSTPHSTRAPCSAGDARAIRSSRGSGSQTPSSPTCPAMR